MQSFSRRKSRKLLFQKLYSLCYNKIDDSLFDESFVYWIYKDNLDQEYIKQMLSLIKENENKLIFLIEKYSPRFDFKNMNVSYILPIYIWATEMLFIEEEIPAKVSINEAIEISKIFWDDSSKKIVNWVLNKIYRDFDSIKIELDNFISKNDFSLFA